MNIIDQYLSQLQAWRVSFQQIFQTFKSEENYSYLSYGEAPPPQEFQTAARHRGYICLAGTQGMNDTKQVKRRAIGYLNLHSVHQLRQQSRLCFHGLSVNLSYYLACHKCSPCLIFQLKIEAWRKQSCLLGKNRLCERLPFKIKSAALASLIHCCFSTDFSS